MCVLWWYTRYIVFIGYRTAATVTSSSHLTEKIFVSQQKSFDFTPQLFPHHFCLLLLLGLFEKEEKKSNHIQRKKIFAANDSKKKVDQITTREREIVSHLRGHSRNNINQLLFCNGFSQKRFITLALFVPFLQMGDYSF
jgi:hypothetical protein